MKVQAPHGSVLSVLKKKENAGNLKFEKKPFDLLRRIHRHIGRQQALPVPQLRVDDRIVDAFEVEQTLVPSYLRIEGD
jgi:hypothetical protein